MRTSVVDLLRNRASVQLNLVNMGLLLTLAEQLDLRVRDNADDGAVFLHLGEIFLDFLLAVLGRPFLGVFGEGLLFGRVPVLVEASSDFLGEMDRLLGVILGKGLDSAFVILASLLGQETQVAVTRRGKFTVRHRKVST